MSHVRSKLPGPNARGALGTAAITLALALAACSGSAAPASQPPAGSAAGPASPAASAPASAVASPGLQAIVDGARKEGKLQLVWGGGSMGADEGARAFAAGLNKRYGLNLDVQFTLGPSMPDMAAKILQEFQTNRPASSDVMLGSEAHFPPLMAAKALETVDWASWSETIKDPQLLGTPDGQAVKVAARTPGITYNSNKIKGDAIPHSMDDLLKPQYKGRIASTSYGANFDRMAADEWWGQQKTLDYLTKFSNQLSGLIRCGDNERVASGEFDIFALDCGAEDALRAQAKGAPVAQIVPTDAASLVYWYMGVPKNAAHPNAAKLFINYVMTPEGQDITWKTSFDDQVLLPGSHSAAEVAKLKAAGVVMKSVDIDFVLRNDEKKLSQTREQIQNILAKK